MIVTVGCVLQYLHTFRFQLISRWATPTLFLLQAFCSLHIFAAIEDQVAS